MMLNILQKLTDFESILKLVDKQYREEMNQIKNYQKDNTPYTERSAHMYRLDGVYRAPLLKNIFLIH